MLLWEDRLSMLVMLSMEIPGSLLLFLGPVYLAFMLSPLRDRRLPGLIGFSTAGSLPPAANFAARSLMELVAHAFFFGMRPTLDKDEEMPSMQSQPGLGLGVRVKR
jgi:hypothetical protein